MDKALELADEFKEENNDWNEDNLRHWGKQTEAMLRQQQAEIEALKIENSHLKYEISSGAWNPVPLTDAELSEVYEEVYINYAGKDFPVDLGRAILLKVKEK